MKVDIAKLQVVLNRKEFSIRKKEKFLDQKDVDTLNNDTIERVLENGENFYQKKISDISLVVKSDNLVSEAQKRIEKDGIFIIQNYLDADTADKLCGMIESRSMLYLSKLGDDKTYEDGIAIVQKGLLIKKDYGELANSIKPVINIREGADEGMIDIFNIDQFLEDKVGREILDKLRKDKFLSSFLKLLPEQLSIQNMNSYVNTGITKTRGFHVDSYFKKIKMFIYLTDVLSFADGPYTFVKETHVDTPYRRMNKSLAKDLLGDTETPIIPFDNVYPILASKGSLVVSDQAGFHRGFPQSVEGSRRVLTINCK
ncbi:hypothetical protein [Psychrobacter namhaensis]|uniref:hypothetical protein n=1 Tax=Psychrobacter namhaensis TaxID=292734 RepID=UPI003D050889